MNTLLTILLILTVGNIVWLILDYNNDRVSIPIINLIFIVVFGWGFWACVIPRTTKNIDIPSSQVEIARTSTTVFVEIDNKVWKFNSHKNYININDSTQFYYEIKYNSYNGVTNRKLKYKN